MSEPRPFHPTVQQVLEAFVPAEGGPVLPPTALSEWSATLRQHDEPHRLATELVVVAMRFRQRGALTAVNQVVWLVAVLLGAENTARLLAESGLPVGEARNLVETARGVAPPLAAGLTPPPGGAGFKRRS